MRTICRDADHATGRPEPIARSLRCEVDGPMIRSMDADPTVAMSALRWLAAVSLVAAAVAALIAARSRRSAPSAAEPEDAALALGEVERERDVSIARLAEAEERERLALDRLASLEPLEARVVDAERRALDAERRLDEIGDRVTAAEGRDDELQGDQPLDGAAGRSAELRDRLARAASRRRPKDR